MRNTVECHSGYAYAERPVAFYWQGKRLEVEEVIAEQRIPEGKRFRVSTLDKQVFDLTFVEMEDEWLLQLV